MDANVTGDARSGHTAACTITAPLPRENRFSAQIGLKHLRILDVINRAGQEVPVQNDQVRQFARLQRADLVLAEEDVRVVGRVKTDRLLARNRLASPMLKLASTVTILPWCRIRSASAAPAIMGTQQIATRTKTTT
jgi:hypothetical protein